MVELLEDMVSSQDMERCGEAICRLNDADLSQAQQKFGYLKGLANDVQPL